MAKECRHIKTNGDKCHAIALRDKPYCYYHMRVHSVMAAAKKPSKSKDRNLEFAFPDSQVSLQLALFQLLNAIGTSKIDPKRASQLLYCLQIATQNVGHYPVEIPFGGVACVTQAPEGDELGPECERNGPGDCGKCTEFEKCVTSGRLKSAGSALQTGKPMPTIPEMFKDALFESLSGLSSKRYRMLKEMSSKPKEPESELPRLSEILKS